MNSNIFNKQNGRVEQISYSGTLLSMNDAGTLTDTTVQLNIERGRIYVIDCIKFVLTYFVNEDTGLYAYPKFEQFVLGFYLKAVIGSANNAAASQLFSEMIHATTDGISNTWLFNEPFILQASSSDDTSLFLTFSNAGSVLLSLGGLVIPPAAAQTININGLITFEGYSFSSNDFDKQKENNYGII